jgi:hypothetical protein
MRRFAGTLIAGAAPASLLGSAPPAAARKLQMSGTWLVRRGGGAKGAPSVLVVSLGPAYATEPTMFPPPGSLILYPGPFVTTMLGNTATMPTGVKLRLGDLEHWQTTTLRGFPHTTGIVLAQQQTGSGGDDFFTVMGSDLRTPLGAGNLSTVAGGLASLRTQAGTDSSAHFDRVSMVFGPPVPSLSSPALAAACALILLAAGYALRRRRA